MIVITFPPPDFSIRQQTGQDFIFCRQRKKWLVLTPEEWVRQNVVQYLLQTLQYPKSLVAVEKEIRLNELRKRFDIIVHTTDGKPWMLMECKAMNVPLNASVSAQILRYNQTVQAQFLVITNGGFTRCFQLKPTVTERDNLPVFGES